MPNWPHLFTNLFYHLGLAVWIGGTVVLGALVAPALFRALPRHQAGAIFGPALRRFARVRVVALLITLVAAAVKHAVWESGAMLWIGLRWAALFIMAATLVYEIAYLERTLETRRAGLTPEMPDDDPRRRDFNVLHKRAEGLLKLSVLAAVAAMLVS